MEFIDVDITVPWGEVCCRSAMGTPYTHNGTSTHQWVACIGACPRDILPSIDKKKKKRPRVGVEARGRQVIKSTHSFFIGRGRVATHKQPGRGSRSAGHKKNTHKTKTTTHPNRTSDRRRVDFGSSSATTNYTECVSIADDASSTVVVVAHLANLAAHACCRWYGNREVRPLVAIHGYTDNLGTFARLLPLLPSHLGVLCIDLPGHGRSLPLPPGIQYSLYDSVSIIRRIVLHFNWKRVSLMGHSFGAVVCNAYASLYPGDHVDMLIAIDLLTIYYKTSSQHINYLVNSVESMLKPTKAPKLYTADQLKDVRWANAPSISKENAKSLLERCIRPSPDEPDKFYLFRDQRVLHFTYFPTGVGFVYELNNRIRNIPYMVIKASNSDFINNGYILPFQILRKNNPKFEFHLVQGNHHVHINDPEQLAAWIVPFIHKYRPSNRFEDPGFISVSKL